MKIDFHLHTNASDGRDAPSRLLERVRQHRLVAWAVTDHDTVAGSLALAGEAGLVPGVEVTSFHDGHEVHVVGLGIDLAHGDLPGLLAHLGDLRHRRAVQVLAAIADLRGVAIAIADCLPTPHSMPTRCHLADALVRHRVVRNHAEAYADLLSDAQLARLGLPALPEVRTVVAAIRSSSGVAILAHPGQFGDLVTIGRILDLGFDGLEVKHPRCPPDLHDALRDLARTRKLLLSAGSDHHGRGVDRIGDWRLTRGEALDLLEACRWKDPLR